VGLYHFEILGAKGNWDIEKLNGFQFVNKGENTFPSSIIVKVDKSVEATKYSIKIYGPIIHRSIWENGKTAVQSFICIQ
jgi:hypothetical protein